MSSPPPPSSASRRVPPPCWTPDETLALIEAYKDKWFALGRGNLRASDWEAVAAAVSSPAESGSMKSPIQCRHKIEKMRKRFRAEKQRILRCPGKFSSSWDLFPLLDSFNFAPSSAIGAGDEDHDDDREVTVDNGFRLEAKNRGMVHGYSGSNIGFNNDFPEGYVSNFQKFNENVDFSHKVVDGSGVKSPGYGDFWPKGIRYKGNVHRVESAGVYPVKSLDNKSLVPLGFKPKNYGKVYGKYDSLDYNYDFNDCGEGGGFQAKAFNDSDRTNRVLDDDLDFVALNGVEFKRNSGRGGGIKRGLDPAEEVVSSIKMLAERFLKMEKMKMEMAKEIEKRRMEMEMRHSQMLLETQQQIVDAFTNALMDKGRKKKVKVLSPNAAKNRDQDDDSDSGLCH